MVIIRQDETPTEEPAVQPATTQHPDPGPAPDREHTHTTPARSGGATTLHCLAATGIDTNALLENTRRLSDHNAAILPLRPSAGQPQ